MGLIFGRKKKQKQSKQEQFYQCPRCKSEFTEREVTSECQRIIDHGEVWVPQCPFCNTPIGR